MIIFDTETTGFLKSAIVDLANQPKIIEFAATKLDDETLKEVDRIEFLVNPEIPLPDIITKITGLTDKDLADQKPFLHYYPALCEFFRGEKYIVAHNIHFDIGMLRNDLGRIGKLTQFPYPYKQICTVNQTMKMKGHRLKLSALYQHLFGDELKNTHRAMGDVEGLTRCVIELIKKEVIKL